MARREANLTVPHRGHDELERAGLGRNPAPLGSSGPEIESPQTQPPRTQTFPYGSPHSRPRNSDRRLWAPDVVTRQV
eukprot:7577596-Pyramimonas_sp.AAC.2